MDSLNITLNPMHIRRSKLDTLIDNRTAYNSDHVQLCVYDTYQRATGIPFQAEQLMLCAITSGKKIMHHASLTEGKPFVSGQSFLIAQGEAVSIDFPEATLANPTSCLTIEIDADKIQSVASKMALDDSAGGELPPASALLLNHCPATQDLYQRLGQIFAENSHDRALLIDLNITELLIRLLRYNSRQMLLAHSRRDPQGSALYNVLDHIINNLDKPIDINLLCKLACMSRTKLYAEFKRVLACTPQAFWQQQRLEQAAKQLAKGHKITQVSYDLGFSDPAHFSRRFKQLYGKSPKQYQLGLN